MKLSFTGLNVALVLLLVPGIARAENPDLMTLIGASSAGDDYAARDNSGNDINSNASTYGLSSSDHNSFAADYGSGGVIRGHGRCSTRAGTIPWNNDTYETISGNFVETLTDETGQSGAQYCYCGLDSYTPLNGTATALSGPWVFIDDNGVAGNCASDCANFCANDLLDDYADGLAFRAAVFNAYAPAGGASGGNAVTTQTYVDNLLSGKQAKITTTGTNKLMTFGSSAGNIGTKDIVSTLGTSTTATTVPEVGPIVAGINSKQDAVNGTANYVMTGTGTAGTLGEKPVYSTTTNYTNALVTAQTINTAAATAANSELSCIDNDCLLWQINTSGPTGISTRIYLNASINGTSYCYRFYNSTVPGDNGACSSATIAHISSHPNTWGTVFPYADVMGISVCATTNGGTVGSVASSQLASSLDWQYRDDMGVYHDGSTYKYCWCKMEKPAASGWVFRGAHAASGGNSAGKTCALQCPKLCGEDVKNKSNLREAMFGSVQ